MWVGAAQRSDLPRIYGLMNLFASTLQAVLPFGLSLDSKQLDPGVQPLITSAVKDGDGFRTTTLLAFDVLLVFAG